MSSSRAGTSNAGEQQPVLLITSSPKQGRQKAQNPVDNPIQQSQQAKVPISNPSTLLTASDQAPPTGSQSSLSSLETQEKATAVDVYRQSAVKITTKKVRRRVASPIYSRRSKDNRHIPTVASLLSIALLALTSTLNTPKKSAQPFGTESLGREKNFHEWLQYGKPEFGKEEAMAAEGEREFFDPMAGTFYANPSKPIDSFFTSKLRWRGEAELAEYAWKRDFPENKGMNEAGGVRHVNMLLTEPYRRRHNVSSNAGNSTTSTSASSSSLPQLTSAAIDPSLMDYEVIDVYWRRDIEQEKGARVLGLPSRLYNRAGDPTFNVDDGMDTTTEQQFERDLQVLTEKSIFAPLNPDEQFHYENLSKAHYTDFYRSLAQPIVQRNQKECPPDTQLHASSSLKLGAAFVDISNGAPTCSRRDNSNAELDKSLLFEYDEEEPEDFLLHLAKENVGENQFIPLASIDQGTINTTQGAQSIQHPHLLSNASLSDALPSNVVQNVTELLETGQPSTVVSNVQPENVTGSFLATPSSLFDLDVPSQALNTTHPSFSAFQNSTNYNDTQALLPPAFYLGGVDPLQNLTNSLYYANPAAENSAIAFNTSAVAQQYINPASTVIVGEDSSPIRERDGASPSSGIGSMCSSQSSPRASDDFLGSRLYNKLIPKIHLNDSQAPRRRGRQSKDDQLVSENGLPATAEQITTMTHQEIQRILKDPTLTAQQKALVKKIRRRGRNKVAARKCRERRTHNNEDEIDEREEGYVPKHSFFYEDNAVEASTGGSYRLRDSSFSSEYFVDEYENYEDYIGPSTSKAAFDRHHY